MRVGSAAAWVWEPVCGRIDKERADVERCQVGFGGANGCHFWSEIATSLQAPQGTFPLILRRSALPVPLLLSLWMSGCPFSAVLSSSPARALLATAAATVLRGLFTYTTAIRRHLWLRISGPP